MDCQHGHYIVGSFLSLVSRGGAGGTGRATRYRAAVIGAGSCRAPLPAPKPAHPLPSILPAHCTLPTAYCPPSCYSVQANHSRPIR